jgi:uncharacterized membrane protein
MRIARVGHAVFAAMWVASGILGLVEHDFSPVWGHVAKDVPAREVLIYVCAAVSLVAGIGLAWRRFAGIAARGLLAYLVLWVLVFRGLDIIRAPAEFGSWDGCAETLVIVAGVWVVYGRRLRLARALYGICMIPFGLAHLVYVRETAVLVPSWLPAHTAWAYFTGGTFLAAGVAVIAGVYARLAAALSTLQMGLFTGLVWIPIVAIGTATAFAWSELGISVALTCAGWVVTDSYGPER